MTDWDKSLLYPDITDYEIMDGIPPEIDLYIKE